MVGLLNLYKPKGPTSFSVCRGIRNILQSHQLTDSSTHKLFKVGHTGTLDPLAEGVLLVCIGKATKVVPFLQQDEKEYVARIRLGQKTETDDAEGKVIQETSVPSFDQKKILKILEEFEGEFEQTPPFYSAVRMGGIRLYHLARKTHKLTNSSTHQLPVPKPRKVKIFHIKLIRWESPEIEIRVICSPGTYIRSLARDVGERLGCGGHLAALKRTRVGKFKVEDSLHLYEINSPTHQLINSSLISMNSALDHLPEIVIPESFREQVLHGNSFPINIQNSTFDIRYSGFLRILDENGTLLAIGKQIGDEIHPLRVLI
ncbi:tRNA pseudouridine(55) synthase TruB [candidate division TA06 bacterium]|nr:tRNA pseudouridine(55) synthase TruB [candidate division TA06 bacterium]